MNYFEIFGLPVSYRLDEFMLTQIYLEKQRFSHPDMMYLDESHAMSKSFSDSSQLNEAYSVLKNPILRAEYFLELNGFDPSSIVLEKASEMLDIREQYETVSSDFDRKKFHMDLKNKMDTLVNDLYNLEDDLPEFSRKFGFVRFIWSFLDRVMSDVYCWN